ncbi:MAG: Signal recognition particle 19 kDa protein [Candidatus Heimdallarchaeota archaeon LC_2]|nr:MAG: Signal recognition particle 19 kDa protein [Candidatus Heimdallarchaeota archaeon LC_2]
MVYPEYFDSKITRSQGRRVPNSLADPNPHLKKLEKACQRLEIECQTEPDKAHPSFWWKQSGRLLIPIDKNNKIPKETLLKNIAKISRKFKLKTKEKFQTSKKKDVSVSKGLGKYKTTKNVSAKRGKPKK